MKNIVVVCAAVIACVLLTNPVSAGKHKHSGERNNTAEVCQLNSEAGPCRANLTHSWYYDKTSGQCRSFIYGGCQGNANRFGTKEICERKCKAGAAEPSCKRKRCRKQCEHGFIINAQGCHTCSCNPNPNAINCPEIECPDRCPNGYLEDEHGCTTCECREAPQRPSTRRRPREVTCPPVCYIYCTFGNKQDTNGCDICECATKEEVCGSEQCMISCLTGFATDARGCYLCECRPAGNDTVKCAAIRCRRQCPHGFRRNSFGCEICECATSPNRVAMDCSARPSCSMYCPHGFVKGADGCDVCTCAKPNLGRHLGKAGQSRRWRPKSDKCGVREMCMMYCQFGFKKDNIGCDICECANATASQLPAGTGEVPSQLPANIPSHRRGGSHSRTTQSPDKVSCPQKRCRNRCSFGYATDPLGCKTCTCKDSREASRARRPVRPESCSNKPACFKYCEHGFRKGRDGCDTCECSQGGSTPVPAPAPAAAPSVTQAKGAECGVRPMCSMYCLHGFKKGADGCDVCECAPPENACELRPMCRKLCKKGFKKGSDGCDICVCA